jgi:RHS repeat-associated protein
MLTSDGLAPRLGVMLTRVTGTRATYTLTYNRAGNRLTEASTITGDPGNGTATTSYDPLDRLASYGLPSINRTLGAGFDAVPNRTTLTTDGTPVTTTFDPANRPTSGGYGYDDDGRMTTRAGSAGTTLRYDSLGRLAEVRADPGNTLVARYGYDAMDRLLTVERPGQATVRFRYAGTTTAVAQVYDETAGTVERNVTTGPEGTVLADWLGTGQRLYGTNGHHDTTFTTDGAGTVTATLRYDPWGNVLRTSGTSLPEWRFQGSWADTVTGLAWSVARWYDPVQGTFITEDTLLGSPASPASRHLYAYGQGDPVGAWDPDGSCWWFLAGGVATSPTGVGLVAGTALFGACTAAVLGATYFLGRTVQMAAEMARTPSLAGQAVASTTSVQARREWGLAFERAVTRRIVRNWPWLHLRFHVFFKTPLKTGGIRRFLDICGYGEPLAPNTDALVCWEVKTGRSRNRTQEKQDRWIEIQYRFPIHYVFGVGISGRIVD